MIVLENRLQKAEVLVIIPARGGSKSIPRKNIKLLHGIPLIAYSIAAGLKASLVTRVIVSTDDEEIATIAKEWGAEVPFMRPKELGRDDTLDLPVFQHALTWLSENENYNPDIVIHLRPTSPFRPPDSIDQAVSMMRDIDNAESVRSIVPSGQNPYKMWIFDKSGFILPLLDAPGLVEPYNMPRQRLPQTYCNSGHIDVIRPRAIMEKNSMTGEFIVPLILEPQYSIDIDNEFQWTYAEWLMNNLNFPIITPDIRASRSGEVPRK